MESNKLIFFFVAQMVTRWQVCCSLLLKEDWEVATLGKKKVGKQISSTKIRKGSLFLGGACIYLDDFHPLTFGK